MDHPRARIVKALTDFFGDDYRRIEHALRVLHHADNLMSGREDCDEDIVVACALLHDVGIKPSEEELGYNDGKTQEEYGPPVVESLLREISFPAEKIEKVKEIVGNHRSPSRYDYAELEILKAADKEVNQNEKI